MKRWLALRDSGAICVNVKGMLAGAVFGLLIVSGLVVAEQNGAGQAAAGTQAGGGQARSARPDNQQAQMKRIQEQLGASEDEWIVLQPKIRKIQEFQRDSGERGGFGGQGRLGTGAGRAAAGAPDTSSSPVRRAARELQNSLSSKDAKAEDIKAKLTALREARSNARADLFKAQDEVREMLTARQEAVLVMSGMLN